ncbi:hypothetical protein HDU96_003962, partial [Phlyctochytrium bullatum]
SLAELRQGGTLWAVDGERDAQGAVADAAAAVALVVLVLERAMDVAVMAVRAEGCWQQGGAGSGPSTGGGGFCGSCLLGSGRCGSSQPGSVSSIGCVATGVGSGSLLLNINVTAPV